MSLALLIEVRFHEGRYHGQGDGLDGTVGIWPPSPGRLFQGMVAGAARGSVLPGKDEQALRWLEGLEPPWVASPPHRSGQSVQMYVPNNDLDSVGGDPARVGEIRAPKSWRPCYFDASQPLRYLWFFDGERSAAERICSISHHLYQFGRGIDMAWADGQILDRASAEVLMASSSGSLYRPSRHGNVPVPQRGTLQSLITRYRRARERLQSVSEESGSKRRSTKLKQAFQQPPKALFGRAGYNAPHRHLHFELRREKGAFAPQPLTNIGSLISNLRTFAAQKLTLALPERKAQYERLIIGQGAQPADLPQRIRLVPIPSIGTKYTDPSIRRIMVEIPLDCPIPQDDLKWAFAGQLCDPNTGEVKPESLVSTDDSKMARRFEKKRIRFRSITPLALSSTQRSRVEVSGKKTAEVRSREERRATGSLVQSLRHAGIRAKPASIRVQREPFHAKGARAEAFAEGTRFPRHCLWHAEVEFDQPVSGPLVIGDGRFMGLGLMEPIQDTCDLFAFHLNGEHEISWQDGLEIISHLRRALMACARDQPGYALRLFSGHESDGRPDRSGHHTHVFLAADGGSDSYNGGIRRLLVVAPWRADHNVEKNTEKRDRGLFDDVVRNLTDLRAGRLGRFNLKPTSLTEAGDPLIGPAKEWKTVTPYVATRNLKKRDDLPTLVRSDVEAECSRRGLPAPLDIEVVEAEAGPQGGRPTRQIRLRFAIAISGPLLLGRTSHAGGGLFHVQRPSAR